MIARSILESYLLEIVARARSAQERCGSLLASDFISNAPYDLAHSISGACAFLSKAAVAIFSQVDWDDEEQIQSDERLLRTTDSLIQELAAHLRYVQGARTDRLPWGIVPSFESLVNRLAPNKQVLLRPKWNYNYSVVVYDLREYYLTALQELEDYLPEINLERDVLGRMSAPFHIIAFPALERENILLHNLLGHEIGHLFVRDFLDEPRKTDFKTSIVSHIENVTDKQLERDGFTESKAGALFWPQIKKSRIAQNTNLALIYWRRALEELLSDVVGAVLFGPAALFSTLEMAMQQGYDIPPSPKNNFYPPWRMRLREVLRAVNAEGSFFPIEDTLFRWRSRTGDAGSNESTDRAKRVNETYKFVQLLCEEREDFATTFLDPIAKVAYERIEADVREGTKFLLEECGLGGEGRRVKAEFLYKNLSRLIERLDKDIPPNALEESIDDRSEVDLVEIINAAWLQRVSLPLSALAKDGTINSEATTQRRRANRLTLKAVEFAGLSRDYWRHTSIEPYARENGNRNAPKEGVLSASEIVSCLERERLRERLTR